MFLFSQGARRSRLQSRASMPSRRAPRRASRGPSRARGWPVCRLALILLGVRVARPAAAQAPPCTVTVSQTELNVSQPGSSGIVTVTVSDPTCVWTADASAPWVHVTSDQSQIASGVRVTGSGSFVYDVGDNPETSTRSTSIIVSTYAATISTLSSPTNGATGVPLATTFQWTAIAGAQAYHLEVGTSVGAKDVVDSAETPQTSYAASNLPAGQLFYARMGTKLAGTWYSFDTTFSTMSGQATCTMQVSPASILTASAGGGGTVLIQGDPTCHWTASSTAPWLILGTTEGTGPQALGFIVAPNSQTSRLARLHIAGGTVTVGQISTTFHPDRLVEVCTTFIGCDHFWKNEDNSCDEIHRELVTECYLDWEDDQRPNRPRVTVTSADVETDSVDVQLVGDGTGTLSVFLVAEDGTQIPAGPARYVSAGAQTFSGWRSTLPGDVISQNRTRSHYVKVTADWSPALRTGTFDLIAQTRDFDVLGVLDHTVYNSPSEYECLGSRSESAYFQDQGCGLFHIKPLFKALVLSNGTGTSEEHGLVKSDPGLCSQSPGFRAIDFPTGAFETIIYDGTVAPSLKQTGRQGTAARLWQDDRILIVGVPNLALGDVVKRVQDKCPICDIIETAENKNPHPGYYRMDNYLASITTCSSAIPGLGLHQTIRLPRRP